MKNNSLIEITDKIKQGAVAITKFSITDKTKKDYFDIDYSQIRTAKDMPHVTQKAIKHYRGTRIFHICCKPEVRKGKYRAELVAYNYGKKSEFQ